MITTAVQGSGGAGDGGELWLRSDEALEGSDMPAFYLMDQCAELLKVSFICCLF